MKALGGGADVAALGGTGGSALLTDGVAALLDAGGAPLLTGGVLALLTAPGAMAEAGWRRRRDVRETSNKIFFKSCARQMRKSPKPTCQCVAESCAMTFAMNLTNERMLIA